jgi:hypothetical protein
MFSKMAASKTATAVLTSKDDEMPDFDPDAAISKSTATGKTSKKLSVERIYQKKTQLEHILLRPDTYIGSIEPVTQVL